MFEKFKEQISAQRKRRIEKRNKPWSKKQKIIFLSVLGAVVLYIVISMLISNNKAEGFSMPSLNLSVSGFDVVLICLLGIGFAIFKIRAYIKRRKGNDK